MKRALILGAGGFIGNHMVTRLKKEGYFVAGIDLKSPSFCASDADIFSIYDLRNPLTYNNDVNFDEVYQFAADMGGCQYIFSGEQDADIMHNSAMINLNICDFFKNTKTRIFYSSSACMYPKKKQIDSDYKLKEEDAYPADPDSEYGWEKLFSERLYKAYERNYGLDVRIARFHNIFGPKGVYEGGKEKAPASISRKVIEATDHVKIWGDGKQTRSFLYIDDCIDAVRLLMQSDYKEPINIGSEESISIVGLWDMAIKISGKTLEKQHIERPGNFLGVMNRNSDNTLNKKILNWEPKYSLYQGMEKTYHWIESQLSK